MNKSGADWNLRVYGCSPSLFRSRHQCFAWSGNSYEWVPSAKYHHSVRLVGPKCQDRMECNPLIVIIAWTKTPWTTVFLSLRGRHDRSNLPETWGLLPETWGLLRRSFLTPPNDRSEPRVFVQTLIRVIFDKNGFAMVMAKLCLITAFSKNSCLGL